MQSLAVPFVVYAMTGSTTWLGLSALASLVPNAAIGPVAGAPADRHSRRLVLLCTQTLMMTMSFGLWALWISGSARPWSILTVVCINGLIGGINISCWQAFVPLLVPREDLMGAVRLNSLQFTVGKALGPAIAGVVLAKFGAGAAFFVNGITFLFVIAALIVVKPREVPPLHRDASIGRQFLDGAAYIKRRPPLVLALATLATVTLVLTGTIQLAPALARDLFDVGRAGYGFMVACYGIGAIVGSIVIAVA